MAMHHYSPALPTISRLFHILKSAIAQRGQRRRTQSAISGECLESRQLLTASFGFDYGTIASDLSPTLRFFGSPNASDAPFTILRYGEGQVTSLTNLGVGYLMPADITFKFGSSNPTAPVQVVTLSSFDNGLGDGIANQVYTPDSNDQPLLTIFKSGVPVAEGRVQQIALETSQLGQVTSSRSTFQLDRAIGADKRVYNEMLAASQGTGVIPFNLTAFNLTGPWAGVGDAQIFQSSGVSLFAPSHAPTNLTVSSSSVAENAPVGTVVGRFTSVDVDAAQTFTYSLVSGTGSSDNAKFTIVGNQLRTKAVFDFETKSSYSIRVQTRDQEGLVFQKPLTISVTNQLDGTAGTDAFVLTYSATNVAIVMSINGGAPINQGTFPLTSAVTLHHLLANDSVRVVGTSGNDVIVRTITSLTVNGAGIVLDGPASLTLAGAAGNDSYSFDADAVLGVVTLDEAVGGVDTIDFSTTTTLGVSLNLGLATMQVVNANLSLNLSSASTFENAAGGSRNDRLTGNSVANVLIGNAGNDRLNGGGGRDILIGGLGLDTLNGGEGDDILIAGWTANDALFNNLNTLRAAWNSGLYATRIANLRAGVGSPVVSLKATVNVWNDAGEHDSLTGGNGTDWFFRAIDDVITDLVAGETLDVL